MDSPGVGSVVVVEERGKECVWWCSLPFCFEATLPLMGCSSFVYLAPQTYARLPDRVAIGIIDAAGMTRGELEGVVRDHETLARFGGYVFLRASPRESNHVERTERHRSDHDQKAH